MIIGTKTEFENLADYIPRDYLGSEYDSYSPLNVDAFAKIISNWIYPIVSSIPTNISKECEQVNRSF